MFQSCSISSCYCTTHIIFAISLFASKCPICKKRAKWVWIYSSQGSRGSLSWTATGGLTKQTQPKYDSERAGQNLAPGNLHLIYLIQAFYVYFHLQCILENIAVESKSFKIADEEYEASALLLLSKTNLDWLGLVWGVLFSAAVQKSRKYPRIIIFRHDTRCAPVAWGDCWVSWLVGLTWIDQPRLYIHNQQQTSCVTFYFRKADNFKIGAVVL